VRRPARFESAAKPSTVEHRSRGQPAGGGDDLREGVVDELLATAPERDVVATADDLGPHAVPFPLGLPLGDGPEVGGHGGRIGLVDRRGEEEGIRAAVVGGRLAGEQPGEAVGVERVAGHAHQPVRHHRRLDAGDLRERPGHERARDADPQSPREQLVPDDPLPRGEPLPGRGDHLALAGLAGVTDRVDRGGDRLGEPRPRRGRGVGGRVGQQQGERLGEVADVGVGILDEPFR
jgi:hypothetical protein